MKSKTKKRYKKVILSAIDKIVCLGVVVVVVVSGGKPLSPIVYKALEQCYNTELPTYDISELMSYIDDKNKRIELQVKMYENKITIDSFSKFKDVLDTKKIRYTLIPGDSAGMVQIKIDGEVNVHNFKVLRSNLNTRNGIKIITKFLNEKEIVVTLLKNQS